MPTKLNKPYLSVVIPAFNEAGNFRMGVLKPALEYLKKQKYSWEIVFVNDGSTDETFKLLSELVVKDKRIRVLQISHGGKAAAVTAGMLDAAGQIILFTDFDQSTPLYHIEKFLAAHAFGADVVIARRTSTLNDTLVRQVRSLVFVKLVQLVALPTIHDSQCGFKSFTRSAAQKIFPNLQVCLPHQVITGSYMGAFDVEVLFLAQKLGLKIEQVPVTWVKILSDRLNIWKEPLQMVLDIFQIRLWDILGKYDQKLQDAK